MSFPKCSTSGNLTLKSICLNNQALIDCEGLRAAGSCLTKLAYFCLSKYRNLLTKQEVYISNPVLIDPVCQGLINATGYMFKQVFDQLRDTIHELIRQKLMGLSRHPAESTTWNQSPLAKPGFCL
jgi:hypothetical protein